jgi:hypothetical protein
MDTATAIIKDSFSITNIGIVIELQHTQNGLAKETLLTSTTSNLSWKIIARILFDHATDIQRIFTTENRNFMHCSFKSAEKYELSRKDIQDRENKNIFQYLLQPLGHNKKPLQG